MSSEAREAWAAGDEAGVAEIAARARPAGLGARGGCSAGVRAARVRRDRARTERGNRPGVLYGKEITCKKSQTTQNSLQAQAAGPLSHKLLSDSSNAVVGQELIFVFV